MIYAKITASQRSQDGRAPWVVASALELGSDENPAGQVLLQIAPFLWHEGYSPKEGDEVLLGYNKDKIEMIGRIITRRGDCRRPRR